MVARPLSPLGPLSRVVATVCIAVHPIVIYEFDGASMALNSSLASEDFFSSLISVNPADHGPSRVHDPNGSRST